MTKPDDILSLFREMSVQETPEAAATAALAWALRHAPVDGGALEISGHRIERIAPEPDPWPTAPLIVADWTDGDQLGRGLLVADGPTPSECYVVLTGDDDYDGYRLLRRGWDGDTLANVVPVKPVPVAELDALREAIQAWDNGGFAPISTSVRNLLAATDALGLDL